MFLEVRSSDSSIVHNPAVKKRASSTEGSGSESTKRIKKSAEFSLPMFSEDIQ